MLLIAKRVQLALHVDYGCKQMHRKGQRVDDTSIESQAGASVAPSKGKHSRYIFGKYNALQFPSRLKGELSADHIQRLPCRKPFSFKGNGRLEPFQISTARIKRDAMFPKLQKITMNYYVGKRFRIDIDLLYCPTQH